MATPNFILSPGTTLPECLTPAAPSTTLTYMESFLLSQGRCVHNVLPDGNCMFRALSHQLYGNDKHHIEVRKLLKEAIVSNHTVYQPYWIEDMPWGKVTFTEHLERLGIVGNWGTQVELQAISDCLNVTVFVCSANPSGIIRWERKARPTNYGCISIPPYALQAIFPFTQRHVELSYSKYHYKSVVPVQRRSGSGPLPPPVIIPRRSDVVIL